MWTWTHLMVSTIVVGPSPEMFLGTVLPDSFDYLNWINHFGKRHVNIKLLLNDESKFNKKNNSGIIWEIHMISHSFLFTAGTIGLALYSSQTGNTILFNFFTSWWLHTLSDYLTHRDQTYPLFPFIHKIHLRRGLTNWNLRNIKVELLGDLILFTIMIFRLKSFS